MEFKGFTPDGGRKIKAMFFFGEQYASDYAKKIALEDKKPVVVVKLDKGYLVINKSELE